MNPLKTLKNPMSVIMDQEAETSQALRNEL